MQYIKKLITAILIVCIMQMCVSCNNKAIEPFEISLNIRGDYSISTPYALIDDSIIYLVLDGNIASYYRYNLNSKEVSQIGTIDNHLFSGKSNTLIGSTLYFYVTVGRDNGMLNVLYGIDLNNNTLSAITEDANTQHLTTLSSMNEQVLSLKGSFIDEQNYISYFDIFNIKNNTAVKENENKMNVSEKQGSAILNYTFYKDKLYTLYEEMDNNEPNPVINVYDSKFKLERTLDVSEIKEQIFSSGISEIKVIDKYIFIKNSSNDAVIGEIVENNIKPILLEKNLEIPNYCSDPTMEENIFYIRKSNKFFVLDKEKNKLNQCSLNIDKDYVVRTVLSDKNKILILLEAPDKKEKVLYLNREDFAEALT